MSKIFSLDSSEKINKFYYLVGTLLGWYSQGGAVVSTAPTKLLVLLLG